MRFYLHQHQFYCGIDLHARSMFVCIMDHAGEVLLHRNYRINPDALLRAVAPYRRAHNRSFTNVSLLINRGYALDASNHNI